MVRKKQANKCASGKGNQGYGLRNAAVDVADEPDAGARANEGPSHTRVHKHART